VVIDDLKPGKDMAERAGVDFIAAGWTHTVPHIIETMQRISPHYCRTVAELTALRAACDAHGLYLYLDGARLAQALTAAGNDLRPEDLPQLCDAFYIGGTKNGLLFGEAMVIVNDALKPGFRRAMKRSGAMLAKGRLLGVQFAAALEQDLWLDMGRHANTQAQRIAAALSNLGVPMYVPSPTNQIFPILPDDQIARLQERVAFHTNTRVDETHQAVRFVTSWATTDAQVDAQVRLVGAILLHGLGVRDTHEGRGAGPVVFAVLGKDGGQHVLQYGKYVILRGKSHLHVQLVKLTGGAVRPGVLVPEAGGDLEVPVKAGGHQQLLELLGCLRQGIELSGVVPGGHQIVPGTLRGGGGQDGGGDLQEAMLCHGLPQGGHYLAPEDDVVLHRRVPQVQIAVLQAGGLVGLPAAVDLEGQFVVTAFTQHFNLRRHYFNVSGRKLCILAASLTNDTIYLNGRLIIQLRQLIHDLLSLYYDLSRSVEIS